MQYIYVTNGNPINKRIKIFDLCEPKLNFPLQLLLNYLYGLEKKRFQKIHSTLHDSRILLVLLLP